MEWELRTYTAKPGTLDAFTAEWRERVVPLRRQFGFEVLAGWTLPDHDQFVWIVGYDGPGTFGERAQAYYESAERAAWPQDPARHLAVVDTRRMTAVPLPDAG